MNKMKKILSFILIIFVLCTAVLYAEVGTDSTSINLIGNVPRNAGVVVPSEVTLVGNFAIAYDYNNTGSFSYISSDAVNVIDLGVSSGIIVLRADYYGNEPKDYSCLVTFSSNGWELKDSSNKIVYNLPIMFSVPTIDESVKHYGVKVEAPDPGAFRLTVPVNSPISGRTVVYVNATWPEDSNLPSGDYSADIIIEVQSSK